MLLINYRVVPSKTLTHLCRYITRTYQHVALPLAFKAFLQPTCGLLYTMCATSSIYFATMLLFLHCYTILFLTTCHLLLSCHALPLPRLYDCSLLLSPPCAFSHLLLYTYQALLYYYTATIYTYTLYDTTPLHDCLTYCSAYCY